MGYKISKADFKAFFPRAPKAVVDCDWQYEMDKAGITANKTRIKYFFANVGHECGGFALPGLTENIGYTPTRAAQIWPNRFPNSEAVRKKYGTVSGWQKKMFDDVYGGRMGNRPGTSDGSKYIGRGGPQWTGRDGYQALQKLTGLPAVDNPEVASDPRNQAKVCCAFWTWKKMNAKADVGDFRGVVKAWNGGYIGMADREARLKGADPIVNRLEVAASLVPAVTSLSGSPDRGEITNSVKENTRREQATVATVGVATPISAGMNKTALYLTISCGVTLVIIAAALAWNKYKKVEKAYADLPTG